MRTWRTNWTQRCAIWQRTCNKGQLRLKDKKGGQPPIFTNDFLLIFFAGGLMRVCYQMQNTITPLYGDHLGFTAAAVGMLTTVCTVASLVLRPFMGGLLDRQGRRSIVLIGTLMFSLATLLCGWAGGYAALVVLRAVQGVGFSAHTTAVNTMATDVLPETRMTEGIGYMGLTGSISMAVAPGIALLLVSGGRYDTAYLLAGAAGLLAAVALFFVNPKVGMPVKADQSAEMAQEAYQGWQRFFESSALKPSLLMLLLSWCYAAASTFLTLFVLGKGFTTAQASIYFTINAVAVAAARLWGGRISQKVGLHRAVMLASLCSMLGFLLIPLAQNATMLWLAALLHGLGYGTVYPIYNALAVTAAPANRRGTAMATFLTAMDLGAGLGAGIWGVIIDWIGMRWMYYLCALLTLGGGMVYGALMKNPKTGGIQNEPN